MSSQGAEPDPVAISRLKLSNFRNYASADIALEPGLVVLAGENGAGKTNLLEAVSLLTPGRGLRRAAYTDMQGKAGTGGFAIHATVENPDGETEIGTGTSGAAGEGENGRKVRINGANATADELHADIAGRHQRNGDPDSGAEQHCEEDQQQAGDFDELHDRYTALWIACSTASSAVFGFGFS